MSKIKKSIVRTIFVHIIGFVVITAFILGYMWIDKEYSRFDEEVKILKEKYIKNQEFILKDHINDVVEYIEFEKSRTELRLKEDIKERTYEAYSIAMNIYNENKGKKSEQEIKAMIVNALRPIRFNKGRGYFFIDTLKGDSVLYPVYPEVEGTSLLDLQDENRNYIEKEEIDLIKSSKEGFLTAYWKKPNHFDEKSYAKITFVKLFEPYDWTIGTGEYIDDVEKDIQHKVSERISQIHFGVDDEQYLFVMDYSGVQKVGGMLPKTSGKDLWKLEDDKGVKVVQEGIKLVKENPEGAFMKQYWIKDNKPSEKLYYLRAIPEWQWVIGTGVFTDEIEEVVKEKRLQLRKDIHKRVTRVTVIVFIIILMGVIFATVIKNIINRNFHVFYSFFEKGSKEHKEIDVDKIYYSELKELAVSANNMVRERNEIEKKIIEVNDKLKRLSVTDGLTGLYNHRYMYEKLEIQIEKFKEKKEITSIIMFDIDYFKRVNDVYGHQCGDKVLEEVAECVESQVRSSDIVGRYGGEEFLIILPDQNLEDAYKVAERLRKEIKERVFYDKNLSVTISGGVVQIEREIETPKKLIKKADELLYKAKRSGRDRIEIENSEKM